MTEEMKIRNAKICDMYATGQHSLRQIGEEFNLSHQRIRDIVIRESIRLDAISRKQKRKEQNAALREAVTECMMIDGKPARTLTEAIKMLLAANKRDLAKAADEITRLEDGLKQDQPPQKPKFTVIDGGRR